jgi:cytochrome P450
MQGRFALTTVIAREVNQPIMKAAQGVFGALQPARRYQMEESNPYFNPFDPDFRANPYPHYQRLLQAAPLRYEGGITAVVVSRYDDVLTVLRDPETFSNHRPERTPFRQLDLTGGAATMLSADPPVHTRLRRLVSRDFTPRRISELTPRVTQITAPCSTRLRPRASSKSSRTWPANCRCW